MKLQEIINMLETTGCGSKQKVLYALKNASRDELVELRNSIDIKLEYEKIKMEEEKTRGYE